MSSFIQMLQMKTGCQ